MSDTITATDIQIWPVRAPHASRVKAMVSITFNHALRISGCKIVEGAKGLFLAYPSEKKPGTDQYFPLFHPIERSVGDRIQDEVLRRFQALVGAAT